MTLHRHRMHLEAKKAMNCAGWTGQMKNRAQEPTAKPKMKKLDDYVTLSIQESVEKRRKGAQKIPFSMRSES